MHSRDLLLKGRDTSGIQGSPPIMLHAHKSQNSQFADLCFSSFRHLYMEPCMLH
jgi:hypothetical protein